MAHVQLLLEWHDSQRQNTRLRGQQYRAADREQRVIVSRALPSAGRREDFRIHVPSAPGAKITGSDSSAAFGRRSIGRERGQPYELALLKKSRFRRVAATRSAVGEEPAEAQYSRTSDSSAGSELEISERKWGHPLGRMSSENIHPPPASRPCFAVLLTSITLNLPCL